MSAFEIYSGDRRYLIAKTKLAKNTVHFCEFLGFGNAHANTSEVTKEQFPLTLGFESERSAKFAHLMLNILLMPV
jgi:hypothetical protein